MTGIRVALESNSESMLSCFGARCCTRTKPIPESSGKPRSSCSNASRPPADAPTPTMEIGRGSGRSEDDCESESDSDLARTLFWLFRVSAAAVRDRLAFLPRGVLLFGIAVLQTFETAAHYVTLMRSHRRFLQYVSST